MKSSESETLSDTSSFSSHLFASDGAQSIQSYKQKSNDPITPAPVDKRAHVDDLQATFPPTPITPAFLKEDHSHTDEISTISQPVSIESCERCSKKVSVTLLNTCQTAIYDDILSRFLIETCRVCTQCLSLQQPGPSQAMDEKDDEEGYEILSGTEDELNYHMNETEMVMLPSHIGNSNWRKPDKHTFFYAMNVSRDPAIISSQISAKNTMECASLLYLLDTEARKLFSEHDRALPPRISEMRKFIRQISTETKQDVILEEERRSELEAIKDECENAKLFFSKSIHFRQIVPYRAIEITPENIDEVMKIVYPWEFHDKYFRKWRRFYSKSEKRDRTYSQNFRYEELQAINLFNCKILTHMSRCLFTKNPRGFIAPDCFELLYQNLREFLRPIIRELASISNAKRRRDDVDENFQIKRRQVIPVLQKYQVPSGTIRHRWHRYLDALHNNTDLTQDENIFSSKACLKAIAAGDTSVLCDFPSTDFIAQSQDARPSIIRDQSIRLANVIEEAINPTEKNMRRQRKLSKKK